MIILRKIQKIVEYINSCYINSKLTNQLYKIRP